MSKMISTMELLRDFVDISRYQKDIMHRQQEEIKILEGENEYLRKVIKWSKIAAFPVPKWGTKFCRKGDIS